MASQAPVKWAQRANALFVTIALPDAKDTKIDVKADSLTFSGTSGGKEYVSDLKFFKEIDPEDEGSKWNVGERSITFHIIKKEQEEEFWPRLLEDKKLSKSMQIDWTKYVDEDDEGDDFDTSGMDAGMGGQGGMPGGMGGMPPGMGGMGGMPGMGGMGGMPGMGGGPGGMDMEALMAQMGGMGGGGAGGAGGMDMAKMMEQMGGMGGMGGGMPGGPDGGDDDELDSDDDDDLPDLEPVAVDAKAD